MKPKAFGSTALLVMFILAIGGTAAQQAPPAGITALPPQLRSVAERLSDRSKSESERIDIALELGEHETDAVLTYLASIVPREPSAAVRRAIFGVIGQSRNEHAIEILRTASQTENDAAAIQLAQDLLRTRQEEASEEAFRSSSPTPPRETLTTTGAVRFVVIGDFGTHSSGPNDLQEQVAKALGRFQSSLGSGRAQFGLTVGDNFYPLGVSGNKDSRWKTDWEDLYGSLGVPFYAVLGNHDHYGGSASVKGQIAYKSSSWHMPAAFYSIAAGDLELFAIDTQKILKQQSQLDWLAGALSASKAKWKIVYGHHPVISGGQHGVNGELEAFRRDLLPLLKRHNVHLYISGHDHDLQMLKVEGQYEAVIGGSGQDSRGVQGLAESLFCSMTNGFGYVSVDSQEIKLAFVRAPDGAIVYECILRLNPTTGRLEDQCSVQCR